MTISHGFTSWHVGVAAEAVAAALFSRCGVDVSVQYGANQPGYDLIVCSGQRTLKVSVKGSKDGSWGLCQKHLRRHRADYHPAIDTWLAQHSPSTAICLVQFKDVPISEMPRVYLARPTEVAARLKATANHRGTAILYEHHVWGPRAVGAGTVELIPDSWRFTAARVEELLRAA